MIETRENFFPDNAQLKFTKPMEMALESKQQDLEDSVLLVEQLDKGNAYFEDQNLKDQQRMV